MLTQKVWEEDFRINTFHLDPRGRTHITAICNFLQEGASMHAETAGFGFEAMLKKDQVWVLARMKVKIERYPKWQENLKLKTWSRGQEGIFYIRDFYIEDQQANIIVKASSSWAAINQKTRRPEMVEGLEKGLQTFSDQKAIDQKLEKIPELQNAELLRKRKIEFTDIDIVYHVNNVKYIELIINSFTKDIMLKKTIACLEINYLGETQYGEEVLIYAEPLLDKTQMVSVIRSSDNKEICRAKIDWK